MSAQHIYDAAPLGSLITFSNGEPRPPRHFTRKLRAWNDKNRMGRLVEKVAGRDGVYPSSATFALYLRKYGSQGTILMVVRRIYSVDAQLHFKVAERPRPGMVRILSRRDGRDELHHLAADMAAAEAWRSEHGYRNAVLELVGDPDPILLPSRLGRAA